MGVGVHGFRRRSSLHADLAFILATSAIKIFELITRTRRARHWLYIYTSSVWKNIKKRLFSKKYTRYTCQPVSCKLSTSYTDRYIIVCPNRKLKYFQNDFACR